jgi:hypothetical protein
MHASLYLSTDLPCHSFQIVSCIGELACAGIMVLKEIKNKASNG